MAIILFERGCLFRRFALTSRCLKLAWNVGPIFEWENPNYEFKPPPREEIPAVELNSL